MQDVNMKLDLINLLKEQYEMYRRENVYECHMI